ncbi:MAG: thioredoxin domain-containing protein [Halobacteriota archaeon]
MKNNGMQHKRGAHGTQGNRLAQEKSPYLIQHARNPVDWYPWGREAFDTARQEDKPIFLSIGYSTCHWCHVMAHESFEDPEIAALMNEAFVNVKVDKEERPDIDDVYMTVCQALTGTGGWPLTIVITPEGKPFFATTYVPKETRFGRTGMRELIPQIEEVWLAKRTEIDKSADEIISRIGRSSPEPSTTEISASMIQIAYEDLASVFDELHGGFRTAPKFPTPHNLTFLMRYWYRTGSQKALKMGERTLQAMRLGGIYDQIGFGFHRYSTDTEWQVPHFEKMLYDQALMGVAYVEAFQATGKDGYARVAHEIFSFVAREMTSSEGAFYTAIDADSEGEEGKFYFWSEDEIERTLTKEDAYLARRAFNTNVNGNFRDERTGKRNGKNILRMQRPPTALASELKMPEEVLRNRLDIIRKTLREDREKRVRPQRDDKILTDWNGLMIASLAKGARALDEPQYAAAAARAVEFVFARMFDRRGRLLHRYRENEAAVFASLDDYAFLLWGLLELYETTFETRYLSLALDLLDHTLRHFRDESGGGFFSTADYAEPLILRRKGAYDGALPSGNSVMMLNLTFLGLLTGGVAYLTEASRLSKAFSRDVDLAPEAYTQLLNGVDLALGPSYQTVVCGDISSTETRDMLTALSTAYLPSNVVVFLRSNAEDAELANIVPGTRLKKCINGKPTAYVCQDYSCRAPTTDTNEMLCTLEEGKKRDVGTAFKTK